MLPEILPCVGFDQRNPHHCYDVWEHTARAVGAAPPTRVLRWTMLLHDLGKPKCFTQDANGIGHFYGHTAVSAEKSPLSPKFSLTPAATYGTMYKLTI